MELDGFFGSLSDGFILTDIAANVVYMNSAAKTLLKVPENPVGVPFNEICSLVNLKTGEPFEPPIKRAIEKQKSMGLARNVGIKFKDKRIYLSATVSPVIEKGEVIGASIFLRDVTRIRELEIKVEESYAKAMEGDRAKGEFLANMSHEIRTPINGFIGMVDLTLRSSLSNTQRENLLSAKTCANDLLQIINDILDYSKLENKKMAVESINLDLYEMLSMVERVHSRTAKNKGLHFIAADREGLPQFIKGDPLRLRQILNNLLTNALKFTEKGSVALSARLKQRNGKDYLAFAVWDTGLGIDMAGRAKLFKAFSQVDGSTTRKFGGTGLGLRIVKELVALMGGSIDVFSLPGKGSCFYFSIPYIEANFDEPEETEHTIKHSDKERLNIERKDITNLLEMCKKRLFE